MTRIATDDSALRTIFVQLVFLGLLFLTTGAFGQSVKFGPGLQQTLANAAPTEKLEVVVTFGQNGPLTSTQRTALKLLGVKGAYFETLPMVGLVATPLQIQSVAGLTGVRSIWPNVTLTYDNDGGTVLTGVDALREDGQFQQMNGGLPFSGRGVGVVINDSGVDGTHGDVSYPSHLVQNVAGQTSLRDVTTLAPYLYVENIPHTDVGGGHGTHVAGIVGGTGAGSGGLYEGVAPGADLIGYGSGAGVALIDVLSGFDYAITHQAQYGIRVITNSWGNTSDVGTPFNPDDPINIATKRCVDRGILVVFSAGNSGPGENTISGNFKKAPWVITVAAGTKSGLLADFSSRGKAGVGGTVTIDGESYTWEDRPTVTAPGEHIISARAAGGSTAGAAFDPQGELLIPPAYLPYYTSLNGTSMAAPHVAGILALMLEAKPQLDWREARQVLQATATTMMGREAFEVGAGYVNAYASVAAVLGLDPTPYLSEPFGDDAGNGDPGTNPEGGVVLTDDEGDATLAGADLTQVSIFEEDTDRFQLILHVADLAEATPSTLLLAGLQVGAMQEYSVEFDLEKADAATIRYTFSAKRPLVDAGTDGVALDEPSFDFGVRAADGSGRGIGDLPGIWDDEEGTITWIITTDLFNVATPPADLTADIDYSGRAAQAGDVLKAFTADVSTSLWGGAVGLTPGQTTYDDGSGTARHTLGAEPGGSETGGDPDPDPVDDEDAFENVRPVLECVTVNDDGTFSASFGYLNDNDVPTTLAVGSKNQFSPSPKDRGQPTTFETGRREFVLDVVSSKKHLVWKLGERTAHASAASEACPEVTPEPRVVVSVIDSGINPYHEFYHAGSEIYPDGAPASVTSDVLDAFGIDAAHTLRLTRTGDFNADFAADAALWAGVNPGEVYWFEGTNLLAVSFDGGSRIIMPDDEDDTHGVGTSSAVLRANPEAVILFVEGITDASEAFAFNHPEVDIITTSYGPIGSVPLPGHVNNSYVGVVENGKLHFGAADNSPSTAIQDGTAGPWWSIGVAGFEEGTSEGKQVLSGSLADFVGDFTQTLPYCAACEDGQQSVGGTSFATPRSAGTASKILLEARRAANHLGGIMNLEGTPTMVLGETPITNWQFRRALEEAAYYPTMLDYDAVGGVLDVLAVPVTDVGPYALVGWGVVTPDPEHGVVTQALAHLGVGGSVERTKDADACTFMTTLITARHAYWDNLNIESESLGSTNDPYVYCGQTSSKQNDPGLLAAETLGETPGRYALDANYPNPFNPTTTIGFALPEPGRVRLAVYNVLGQQVRVLVEGPMQAGAHQVAFDADDLASGTYLYRLEAPGFVRTRQMTLVK